MVEKAASVAVDAIIEKGVKSILAKVKKGVSQPKI